MFVVTFYSYKGGVGRTLALVNCAFRLARQGKKVFILDFDLEAPGVDAFRLCGDGEARKGIVEYIGHFREGGEVEPLKDYVCELDPETCRPGAIHFMPAGRKDEEYQISLSLLDWKYFYKEQAGFFFVENLKASIEKEYAPDYVLIDSRTGLTDIAGICTLQLPDLVVLLFNLNNQNVLGIRQIYRSIRRNKLNKEIQTLLVASPIPDVPGYSDLKERRLKYAQETIEVEKIDMTIPFDPLVTFEETVLNARESSSPLEKSYGRLSETIRKANASDVLTMLEHANELVKKGDVEDAELEFQKAIEFHPNEPRALVDYAQFLLIRRDRKAIKYLQKALELRPEDAELIGRLIRANLSLGKSAVAASHVKDLLASARNSEQLSDVGSLFEGRGMIEPALELYGRAMELAKHPNKELQLRLDLGNVYMASKKPKLALEQYESALKEDPSNLAINYNYAYALSVLRDSRSQDYFERAISIYERQPRDFFSVGAPNVSQAMSNAYAACGKKKKAIELLNNAILGAQKSGPNRRHFSSIQYKYITRQEFISETRALKKNLASDEPTLLMES